ncbi:GntR family transcriptional regulator [Streptomyces sp. 769]|uniref:GntR family transcriptional regulator n=1 Tax=Streptomyces sp. 769 TaxID=1262452 RepID=UPI00099BA4D2|nr:GntR family transcriptional regulator [Streptomyces sp. 769]
MSDALTADIRHGRYKPGGHIPSEPELCNRFNVARETVRRVVRVLRERGLIFRRTVGMRGCLTEADDRSSAGDWFGRYALFCMDTGFAGHRIRSFNSSWVGAAGTGTGPGPAVEPGSVLRSRRVQ